MASKASDIQAEQELLSRYKITGDLNVLGKLYAPYMYLVYGICLKYFKEEARSEDAVMQIFEELIPKLRVHQVAHFKSWLYTYARNFCLMALRSAKKIDTISLEEHPFMENEAILHPSFGDDLLEIKLSAMEKCMDSLSQEQHTCIQLFYLEHKCYKEIVDITGFDLNKVKSYIQNGKRNLKICMEKHDRE